MSTTDTDDMDGTLGTDDRYAVERRRAHTYALLGECFHEPTEDRLAELAAVDDETVAIDVSALREATGDEKALRLDHAKLFVGPFELAAPPYESVYVDAEDRVMTDATEAVQAEYRQAGVDVAIDEPADHIAAELEFVSLLVATEVEALEAGDDEAVRHYLDRQYEFLSDHLGRWVSEIADNMRNAAETEFYQVLADETQSFVEGDGQRLANRLNQLETTDDDVEAVLGGDER
ncbi:TorA maturation chaperone TorD [Halorubrum alkaliphilum]|uniref:TorA maturation chaperone TorD n=1 Tax=Halorubrum alkaliphilum TaxID=261290 RepID=A0A8T4GHP6_9EURY|nr:molecular chaperone TorD family protein [Halorubrum alkaliphilum]MBP1923766.1 TorA maturation chaperone TorD [Halorubrum alkaliphilum]